MHQLKFPSRCGGAFLRGPIPWKFTKYTRVAHMLDEWNDRNASYEVARCHVVKSLIMYVTDSFVP